MGAATDVKLDLDPAGVRTRLQISERIADPYVVRMIGAQIIEPLAQRIIAIDFEDDRGDFIDVCDQSGGVDQD